MSQLWAPGGRPAIHLKSSTMKTIKIDIELTEDKAWALAQYLKRLCWEQIRQNAVSDDDAYTMRDALGTVQDAVNRAGANPR